MGSGSGRLAFTPSLESRRYFEELGKRLARERGLKVHCTQREAFDELVRLARRAEAGAIERFLGPRRVSTNRT